MAAAVVEEIRRSLREVGDPERGEGMRAYLKSDLPCLGVTAKERRAIVGQALGAVVLDRSAWLDVVHGLWAEPSFREERHAAIDVLAHRSMRSQLDVELLGVCRRLIVEGAWWDLVDAAAGVVNDILDRDRAGATPIIRGWATDDDLWVRRVSIIAQLRSKERTDQDLLTHAIGANASSSEFFLRKAIGWALRQYARTDPDWVWAYVDANAATLSSLSLREATKHR